MNSNDVGFIYITGPEDSRTVKIGKSKDFWQRLERISKHSHVPLLPKMIWKCVNCSAVESALHSIFKEQNTHAEWFEIGSPEYDTENHRLIMQIALHTTLVIEWSFDKRPSKKLPVLVSNEWHYHLQYGHIPDDDPEWDTPGGADFDGREKYPPDKLVRFKYEDNRSLTMTEEAMTNEMLKEFGLSRNAS